MVGVSRTTVSNVLHGNTKRVSPETLDKIQKILKETLYQPNIGSMMLSGKGSGIIGFAVGYEYIHGHPALMDAFMSRLLSAVEEEAVKYGYYLMIIDGSEKERLVEIASRWNVEGMIFIGFSEESYDILRREINKKAILVDTYTKQEEYTYQNVGIDDYDGGYQVGKYLRECGYPDALFIAESTRVRMNMGHGASGRKSIYGGPGLCNEKRWDGFKAAMEAGGTYCRRRRFIIVDQDMEKRRQQYTEMLPRFLEARALAMASDYNAIEIINFLRDHGIRVPEQISVTGFDDCIYAEYIRPRLTTVYQDVDNKGRTALRRLMKLIQGETLPQMHIMSPVKLIVRDSVLDHRITKITK